MNTYTNAAHPKEKLDRAARKNLLIKLAIITIILMLVTTAAISTYSANRPVAAVNNPSVPYSNALELQYARPWLEAQNKPVVTYSHALEMQYASPWLEAQNKPIVEYGNALELQYAQPWLDGQIVPVTGLEAQIAPVYDATGAMLEAINPDNKVVTVPAYDATGAMLEATTP